MTYGGQRGVGWDDVLNAFGSIVVYHCIILQNLSPVSENPYKLIILFTL